jgi:DNA-binding CsgD family transcriptional regulator
VCVVDDAQWLDRASAQALAFAARRLLTESVLVVLAEREPSADFGGLPELVVGGLRDADARELLDSVVRWPLDERVREQILAETRGNPLALLELPRGLSPAELAGGFALPAVLPLSGRIEQSFLRRVESLPEEARRLLLLAAAEPLGDPALVWHAARRTGMSIQAGDDAEAAGLLEIGGRVVFRHPLVRSAVYRAASRGDRQKVHAALADAIDPQVDPDRRAWHRAHATVGPDEGIADELERSAGRAQARGGLAAAAAFLERAAMLTPDPARRARRGLAAARAKRDAGALDAALGLLVAVQTGPLDALSAAEVQRLRGQIALDQRRGRDAARLLLSAARRLESVNAGLARETHLEALGAAMWAGDLGSPGGLREAAEAARAVPPGPEPPQTVDVLLDAFALRFTEGYAAAAPTLTRALELILAPNVADDDVGHSRWLAAARHGDIIVLEVCDAESGQVLAARQVRSARESGALVDLQFAQNFHAWTHLLAGELTTAALLIEEDRLIAEATGNPPIRYTEMMLAAWRGRERDASELIRATLQEATARGQGRTVNVATYASSVLYNGLGRYDAARAAAWRAFQRDQVGYGPLVVTELAEAASRTGEGALVAAALEWLSERTRSTRTEWALGIEARIHALMSEGAAAERRHRESIARLGRTCVRAEVARAHLLYGEWLRRENRRLDAREQLRIAFDMLTAMGVEGFAERARRELLATGETVRKRSVETLSELTEQEAHIARLAGDGRTNPEISTQLFISPRTVEWHLHKVFAKLGINSRRQLRGALPHPRRAGVPAYHSGS